MIKPPDNCKFYVYNYLDVRPGREGQVIYVGKGTYSQREKLSRMNSHWLSRELRNKLFFSVLEKIRALGLEPIRQVVSWHETEDAAFAAEMMGISEHRLRQHGGTLCNLTFGGEGPTGSVQTAAVRAVISQAAKRNWQDLNYMIQKSRSLKATLATPEAKSKKAKEAERRWADPNFKEKTRSAIKAAKNTPEAKAKVSEAAAKIWAAPGMKEAFSARMKEVLNSPEEKARKAAATKAKWADPEFRAKMMAARAASKLKKE